MIVGLLTGCGGLADAPAAETPAANEGTDAPESWNSRGR